MTRRPEIRQEGPGNCPICGMALEPATVTAETEPNLELIDMTRHFWVGAALSAPIMVLVMAEHLPGLGLHDWIAPSVAVWVQFALATPVVLWAGWPLLVRGWRSFRAWRLNMFSLIALGVSAAYIFSLVATFAPGIFPEGFRGAEGVVAVYYEAAAVITVLVLLGQVIGGTVNGTGSLVMRAEKVGSERNIRQNIFLAFVYNALGVPIAAGLLYPVFGWLLSPIITAAAMSLSSVSVIANALRLRWARL